MTGKRSWRSSGPTDDSLAWKVGDSAGDESRDPLESLAAEYLDRQRRGEHPTIEEYAEQHPHLAEEIRDLFPALSMVERFKDRQRVEQTDDLAAGAIARTEASGAGSLTDKPAFPDKLGEFRLLEELGRGGMGIVYLAEQTSLARPVAVKILPGQGIVGGKMLARFRREVRAVASLDHPNILSVYAVGEDDGLHYYAMQYVHGIGLDRLILRLLIRLGRQAQAPAATAYDVSIADEVQQCLVERASSGDRGASENDLGTVAGDFDSVATDHTQAVAPDSGDIGRTPTTAAGTGRPVATLLGADYYRQVARIGLQAARALQAAHERGICHRDIKPSNLLIDARGRVYLADFGLAKFLDPGPEFSLTAPGDVAGTLRYLAPERLDGRGDERSDLFALGATLYELLALHPAYDGIERSRLLRQIMQAEKRPLVEANPDVPPELADIVEQAMAADPADRQQSAAEMVEELQEYLDELDGRPARRVDATLARSGPLWWPWILVGVLVVCLFVGGGVVAGVLWALASRAAVVAPPARPGSPPEPAADPPGPPPAEADGRPRGPRGGRPPHHRGPLGAEHPRFPPHDPLGFGPPGPGRRPPPPPPGPGPDGN